MWWLVSSFFAVFLRTVMQPAIHCSSVLREVFHQDLCKRSWNSANALSPSAHPSLNQANCDGQHTHKTTDACQIPDLFCDILLYGSVTVRLIPLLVLSILPVFVAL